jgi:hypothetical protein
MDLYHGLFWDMVAAIALKSVCKTCIITGFSFLFLFYFCHIQRVHIFIIRDDFFI